MNLSAFHQCVLAIGVARVIARRAYERRNNNEGAKKRRFEVVAGTSSDDGNGSGASARHEIESTLRGLSASGVPQQFPHAVEVLFDFMLFDADTERTAGGGLLADELVRLVSSGSGGSDGDDGLHGFVAHVTRRLVQRTLGASDSKFCKVLAVLRRLLCDAAETVAVVARPTAYARPVLEAVGEAMRLIGALDLNLVSDPTHFRVYERLGPLGEVLTTGLLREVAWARQPSPPLPPPRPMPQHHGSSDDDDAQSAEAWALSVLARSFDATGELPLVRAAYLRCVDRIEGDNMRSAGTGFSH
jgi:hypothetical protein